MPQAYRLIYHINENTIAIYGGQGGVTESLSYEDADELKQHLIGFGVDETQIEFESLGIKPNVSHGRVESMTLSELYRQKFG